MAQDYPLGYLNTKTGMVTYRNQVMTYAEYLSLLDEEDMIWQDEINEARDFSSDLQNLWGNKSNGFKDDWFFRKKALKRIKGYPSEVEGSYYQ